MKLSTLVNSQQALKNLLELKLPIKVSYKISKLISRMEPDFKIFDEQKFALVKKLGLPTDTQGEWKVLPKNMTEFQEDLTKLLDVEVDLGYTREKPLEKIKLEDLGEVNISTQDLLSLSWLIE